MHEYGNGNEGESWRYFVEVVARGWEKENVGVDGVRDFVVLGDDRLEYVFDLICRVYPNIHEKYAKKYNSKTHIGTYLHNLVRP